ncbi:MAG: LamG-like jellyroll fold domain-containing protein [Bacteroidota bacterium]
MKRKITLLIALISLFLNLEVIQAQTPEILYYNFNGVGTTVPNQALTPPVGAENATLIGGITLGGVGQCGTTALVGSGVSSTTDYLNTNWSPNLGTGSWTISFWSSGISSNATLYYIFGDANTDAFRCFTNGVAGANNWILRGAGLTDILLSGGAISTPTMNTFVYDNVANNVKAYLNGVLVNTVAQSTPNITGAGPFKVMGYGSNVGAPTGGLLDEFGIYNRALSDAEVLSLSIPSSPPPTVTTPVTYVQGATATPLTATGTNLLWYTSSTGGTGDPTAPTPSTTTAGTTSYWVSQTSTCGEGQRAQIDVVVAAAGPASALNFDGFDDRVSLPNQPVSNLTNFTFEAWVKTSDNNYQTIYSEGNSSDDNPMFSLTKMPNTSGFEIVLRNEFGIGLVVSSTIGYVPLSTWTHVAFTRTSATSASLYINGVNTDNFTFSDPGNLSINVANIGVRQRVGFDGFFNGSIDEVRIWNRTLPQTEITNNMNCELGASQTGLLAYYKFNQGIDNADNTAISGLSDLSGNNNNGTLINFTLNGPTSNWANPGGVTTGIQCTTASALNFDGVNDYASCGNSALLNVTGSLSVEAFINRSGLNTDDCIIGKDIYATNTGYSFWVYQNNKLVFRFGNIEFPGISSIIPNTWTHVAATYESGVVKLYINGVLDATYTGVAPPVSNTNGLFLGTPQDAVGNSLFAFSGKMDEVRVWNRGLGQCEIQNNMNGELPSGQTGLLAYYQFNQGIDSQDNAAITGLVDFSGNGNNGFLNNFTLNGPTSNWVNPGGVVTGVTSPAYSPLSVATTQTLNSTSTVANLIATGTNINWYDVPTGGTALLSTTTLTTGIYYVTQTTGTCESDRTAVQVNIVASALNFDGSNDKVIIGNMLNTALAPINTVTVEAWVNPTNTTFNGVIVGNYYNSNNEMQFLLRRDFDTFTFWVNDGNSFYSVDSGLASVTLNAWQHVAGVWDGSSIYIYVDGVLKGTTTGVTGSNFAVTNNDVVIGSNSYPEPFAGSIDEVRIWNRNLSQCEIQNNMNGELPGGQTGLLAYYQFNQGIASADNTSETTLFDSSGNNYNGTLNNFALVGATSNWVNPGGVTTGTTTPIFSPVIVTAIANQELCTSTATTSIVFSSSTTGTLCGQTNEGGTINLTAPLGAVFTSIPFASYGTPNGSCGNYSIGSCHAANSSSVVSSLALGQNNFSIVVNNGTFGDPCAFTAKRMYIQAVYNSTTFNWTNDMPSIGLAASGTGSIPSFTAINTGNTPIIATITVTPTDNGCSGIPVQFTITVNPTPTEPTASSQEFCGSATVANLVATGTNLNWYDVPTNGTALTTTTALSSGTYYVSQTIATCESLRTAVSVIITPNTSNATTATACNSYVWTVDGATYNATGNYAFVNGCHTETLDLTINSAATPTGSSSQVINGGVATDTTIEDIVITPTTVTWYATLADALAETNPLPAGTQLVDGAEYFAVNEENGCSSTPFAVTVTVVLGNDTFDNANFNLYPNPTSGVITLQYSSEITEVSVLNLLGQTILNKKLNSTETTIDLSNLPSAAYFVKVVSEGKIKIVKVIKR